MDLLISGIIVILFLWFVYSGKFEEYMIKPWKPKGSRKTPKEENE